MFQIGVRGCVRAPARARFLKSGRGRGRAIERYRRGRLPSILPIGQNLIAFERFRPYAGVQSSPVTCSHNLLIIMASATTAATPDATATAATTAIPMPLARLAGVGLIVFLANAALLVLQLVAGRLLAPFVGSSLETWTSIIGVFLLGIALGNALGGRLADRYPSPRTLALVLAAGAITAVWMVVFPMLLASTGAHKSIPLGPRIPLLALALCLPAGFVLSLLTPLAIKLGLPDVAHTGRVAGMVFALSTLGCLLGNYLTGFVLIPAFTIDTLTLASAGALAALAAGTVLLLRDTYTPGEAAAASGQQFPAGQVPPGDRANDPPPRPANPHAFTDIRLAYLIVFLA